MPMAYGSPDDEPMTESTDQSSICPARLCPKAEENHEGLDGAEPNGVENDCTTRTSPAVACLGV